MFTATAGVTDNVNVVWSKQPVILFVILAKMVCGLDVLVKAVGFVIGVLPVMASFRIV